MMNRSRLLQILLLLMVILLVAACAPADADVTPTLTNTPAPTATATPQPTAVGNSTPTQTVAEASNSADEALLQAIIAAVPDSIPAGAVEWRKDTSKPPETLANITNGTAIKVYFSERGGGQSNLTYGVFDTPEDAVANYERIRGIRSSLATGQTNDQFPLPNIFGSGLYGSNALFQIDNIFVEVSVELFSSTAGNPLPGLSREALKVLDNLPTGEEVVAEAPTEEATPEEAALPDNESMLNTILAQVPQDFPTGAVQWQKDASRPQVALPNLTNGVGQRVYYTERGGGKSSLAFGVFDTAEDAESYYQSVADSRTQLQGAQAIANLDYPSLYKTGLYGSMAIARMDNLYIEAFIEQISGVNENPIVAMGRGAVRIAEAGLAASSAPASSEISIDVLVAALAEFIRIDDAEWQRSEAQSIESENSTLSAVTYTNGEVTADVRVGIFSSVDDAYVSGQGLRAVLPSGDFFVLVAVDADAGTGLFSEIVKLVESAIAN